MARTLRHLLTMSLACAVPTLVQAAANDLVARGAYLARVGDCVACHTAPGGKPYAGGLYLNTPFGSMATPNLTPDQTTGIGAWSDDDFYRAMHQGVRKDGANLYPGLPYQWFTHVTRDDVLAIKAYLFSLPPVKAPTKPNHLVFPFNVRAGIAGWNALYFKEGTFQPDNTKSAAWNRGAYLVEGLGHCAACHTPKNTAQAPVASEAYAGGKVDDWFAPNITSDVKQGIGTWSTAVIVKYLKTGAAGGRGAAFGPMAQTVHDSLSHLNDDDLQAMAVYLKTIPAKETYRSTAKEAHTGSGAGQEVYLSYCSSCHQPDGRGIAQAVPALSGNGAVNAKGPEDVVHAILGGLPAEASYGPMPGLATVMTTQQIAEVTNYVRSSWGNGAPATATMEMVSRLAPKSETMLSATHWCTKPDKMDQKLAQAIGDNNPDLQGINDTNMLPRVQKLVANAKAGAPGAPTAAIVNQLTSAYCPVVFKDAAIRPAQRAPRLDRFASLVYTELQRKE